MSYPGPPALSPRWAVFRRWRDVSLNVLYPPRCRSCAVLLQEPESQEGLLRWLCPRCVGGLDRLQSPCCSVCGEAFEGAMDGPFRCSNCEDRRFAFDFALSAFRATGPMRELLHKFKYNGQLTLRTALAEALRQTLEDERLRKEDLADWLLVPVPLHWLRYLRREFNQSWELCRELSRSTGIPAARVLRRTRHTPKQARLTRHERLENLRGVFALRRGGGWPDAAGLDLTGRKILLVDDVLTTGATTHECAQVLRRQGGAARVVVLTAARG